MSFHLIEKGKKIHQMQSSVAIINWYTKERPSSVLIDYNGSTGNEVAFEIKKITKKSYRSPCTTVINQKSSHFQHQLAHYNDK